MSSNWLDKDVYCAVCFAIKLLKKGTPNAVKIASNYYKADESKVRAEISRRSGMKRKGKKRGEYHYYIGIIHSSNDAGGFDEGKWKPYKTISALNLKKRLNKYCLDKTVKEDTGSSYCWCYWADVGSESFESEEEAQKRADKLNAELRNE